MPKLFCFAPGRYNAGPDSFLQSGHVLCKCLHVGMFTYNGKCSVPTIKLLALTPLPCDSMLVITIISTFKC